MNNKRFIKILLISITVLAGFVFIPAAGAATVAKTSRSVLVLPHVEATGNLMTGLYLLNKEGLPTVVTIRAYNEFGGAVGEGLKVTIAPKGSYLNSLADIFGQRVSSVNWLKVVSSGRISGFGMIGSEDQITRVPLESGGVRLLTIPYIISRGNVYTRIHLLNVGQGPAHILIRALDSKGVSLAVVRFERLLKAGEKLTRTVKVIFGKDFPVERVSSLSIESSEPLMGLALIGAPGRLFTVPME